MVRPLPNGNNWTAPLLAQCGVAPGALIRVTPSGVPGGAYPHRTEDTPVSSIQFLSDGFSAWTGPAAPGVAESLSNGFEGHLRSNSVWQGTLQGIYVPAETQCPSLVGVRISRQNLSFTEEFQKLKVTVNDGFARYKLAVSSRALKEAWRAEGMAGIQAALPNRATVLVRVGLARPFGNPADKCYLMVNGVL